MTRHIPLRALVSEYIQEGSVPGSLKRYLRLTMDHLYHHADIYDAAYKGQKGDKKFYVEHASKGKVLYLGIGSGRIFKKITSINPNAFGLDYSQEMTNAFFLKHLAVKDHLIFADVRNAQINPATFDTIIAPFCFLNQFEYDDVVKILHNCFKWLKPGGKFFTDFFSPFKNPVNKIFYKRPRRKRKDTFIDSFELYNFVEQKLLELTFIQTKKKKVLVTLPLYYYFPNEILRIFKEVGFSKNGFYGDFKKTPFTVKSDVIVTVMHKH